MPQDAGNDWERLERPRDDVAYGPGGLSSGPSPVELPETTGEDLPPPAVATGDRHDAWVESDPDQLVRVRYTRKPDHPLPQDLQDARPGASGEPVEDVTVVMDESSVWDARPPGDAAR